MAKNICIRESYIGKDGVEKVSWHTLGVLIDGKNGKQYVKWFTLPGALLSVFEPKPKEEKPPVRATEDVDFNPEDF